MPDFDFFLTGTTLFAFAATVALAFLSGHVRRKKSSPILRGFVPAPARETVRLPVEHDDADYRECVTVSQHVADLMIADEWIEIARKISDWEATLTSTPGGARYHEIAVRTCLSGLQGLVDDAPRDTLADLRDAEIELAHFMDSHHQSPNNHVLALLAARAQIVVGNAFGSQDWPQEVRRPAWRKMAQNFIAAGDILRKFDAIAYMSPLLAEAHYLHALGSPGGVERLPVLFEDWIDLDPSNSHIYERHVSSMVANDAFNGDDVLREAEAALERTVDSLGFGGYALFFMPLLSEYDSARDLLDIELYASALTDLASHSATQAEVNISAAALLTEIEGADETTALSLKDALVILIRKHLEVIYPRVWPISVSEVQELVAEAAEIAPDIGPDLSNRFVSRRVEGLAA